MADTTSLTNVRCPSCSTSLALADLLKIDRGRCMCPNCGAVIPQRREEVVTASRATRTG